MRGARLGTPTAERLLPPWPSAPRPSSGSTSTPPASLPPRCGQRPAARGAAAVAPLEPGHHPRRRGRRRRRPGRRPARRCTAPTRGSTSACAWAWPTRRSSCASSTFRYLEDAKELAAAVRFQAQDQLPMPLEHAVLDYQPLDVVTDETGRRQRVLLVAARREMVERVLAALRGAGLKPEGIDLSAFAMVRALHRAGPERRARPLPRHRRPHQPRGRPWHRLHLRPRLRRRRRGPRRRARRAQRADARARPRLARPRRRRGARRVHRGRSADRGEHPSDPARRRAPHRRRGAQLAGLPPHATTMPRASPAPS